MLIRRTAIGLVLVLVLLAALPVGAQDFEKGLATLVAESLPSHTVASDRSVALPGRPNARKITIHVDGDISRDQCVAIIKKYASRAGFRGQVSVHKLSKLLGSLFPWCVDNRDGKPIRFNDEFFPK